MLARLILWENAALLLGGLGVGCASALVAILPHLLAGGAAIPFGDLTMTLVMVISVGTLAGGALPEVKNQDGTIDPSPGKSRLERASLQRIAAAGGGQYYELDRDPDHDIANAIIDAVVETPPPVPA